MRVSSQTWTLCSIHLAIWELTARLKVMDRRLWSTSVTVRVTDCGNSSAGPEGVCTSPKLWDFFQSLPEGWSLLFLISDVCVYSVYVSRACCLRSSVCEHDPLTRSYQAGGIHYTFFFLLLPDNQVIPQLSIISEKFRILLIAAGCSYCCSKQNLLLHSTISSCHPFSCICIWVTHWSLSDISPLVLSVFTKSRWYLYLLSLARLMTVLQKQKENITHYSYITVQKVNWIRGVPEAIEAIIYKR